MEASVIHSPQRLAQSRCIDHTAWTGKLKANGRDVMFSDIDAVLEFAGFFIFVDFKVGPTLPTIAELPRGQVLLFARLLAGLEGRSLIAVACHTVDAARRINSLSDVDSFSLMVSVDGVLTESVELPGAKWEPFIIWANQNGDKFKDIHRAGWFQTSTAA